MLLLGEVTMVVTNLTSNWEKIFNSYSLSYSGNKWSQLKLVDLFCKHEGKDELIGKTHITYIKKFTFFDVDTVSLKNLQGFSSWLRIANKCGFKDFSSFYSFLTDNYTPSHSDEFLLITFKPLKNGDNDGNE